MGSKLRVMPATMAANRLESECLMSYILRICGSGWWGRLSSSLKQCIRLQREGTWPARAVALESPWLGWMASKVLAFDFFAFEEEERDKMHHKVHLEAWLDGGSQLRQCLGVAAHSRMEVAASEIAFCIFNGSLHELLSNSLHCWICRWIINLQRQIN